MRLVALPWLLTAVGRRTLDPTMPGRISAACLVLLLAAACFPRGEPDGRRFELTGVVTGRDAASSRVLVAHEAIQGLMPAMTMPFEVRGDAPSLRAGDRIAATLVVTETATWLEKVRITAVSAAPAAGAPASRAAPGALVPDLSLTDQAGRSITLRDFAGRVLVVTFIYTRCPLPDFCPLMVRHLEAVRRRAEDEGMAGSLALLGVTLDPAFDTPAVLQQYGESVLQGEDRFTVWTLGTGSPAQIEALAGVFGIGYGAEKGLVTHTLGTAVVGHDGRAVRLFPSNAWTPDDLFEAVRTGTARMGAR